MKKTYIGELGQFEIDRRLELPDATAKQLITDKFAVPCCAPYDDFKDKKLAKRQAQKGFLLLEEAKLGKQITELEKQVDIVESAAKKISQTKSLLANLKKRYDDILGKLESFGKGKKDAKTNTESESADHTDETDTEQKGDSDNAAGQAAPTGQTQE